MTGQRFHPGQESGGLYPRNRYNPGQNPARLTENYSYGEEDFRFGFNSAQTTLGGLAQLAGLTLVRSGQD